MVFNPNPGLGSWFYPVGSPGSTIRGYGDPSSELGQPGDPGFATTNGAAQQQNPYDWTKAFEEQERSRRQESDRQYQLQLQTLEQQRQRDAVAKGTAAANAAYNQGVLQLSQAKLAEDKRQFDTTTQEAMRQFNLKQQELSRQFDLTTAEGKRQFEIASSEGKRQFDATFGQRAQQFQQDLDFKKSQLGEGARQFDLTRADQLDQFALQFGLDKDKVREQARQFDLSRADQREQFLATLAENHRQFDVNASGYINGAPTLEREKWQNQALLDWTSKAIDLASNPADWIKYKQMTSGVAGNIGNIPGLSWTEGGQQGNTAFEGTPQANSLGNVLGQMGVQQPAPGAGGLNPVAGGPNPLNPAEQSRFDEITRRRAALQAAGEGDVSADDLAELGRYQARGASASVDRLDPAEQARYDQITERQAQQRAAGEALDPNDSAELARYQARGAGAGPGAFAPGRIDQTGAPVAPGGGGASPFAWAPSTNPGAFASGPIDQTGAPVAPAAGGLDLSKMAATPGSGGYDVRVTNAAPAAAGSSVLTPAEQSRYQQITARRAQLKAAGEPDVSPQDLAELGRYQARMAQPAAGAPAASTPTAGVVQQQQPGQTMNWAYQAANMVPTGPALRNSLSAPEQQIWDTADQFSRNPQGQAPGWYESQDPLTKELLRGASQAQGNSWATVMSRLNRSKWGGGGAARAA